MSSSFATCMLCKHFGGINMLFFIQAPIFISPNWELEFHVHTNASQLTIGAILA